MPFVALPYSKTYHMAAIEGISIVLSRGHRELDAILEEKPPIKSNALAVLTRVHMPNKRIITRLIQIVILDKSNDRFKCCENTKRIHWWPEDDVLNGNVEKLWGPEVALVSRLMNNKVVRPLEEYSFDRMIGLIATDDQSPKEKEIIEALGIESSHFAEIYNDFVEHCFPSFFMTIESFRHYMSKYGYQSKDTRLIKMFNAFTAEEKQYLTFEDLFLGLMAMEPKCPHTEFRFGLIFRYYDMDGDQSLSQQELRLLLTDLNDGSAQNDLEAKAKDIITSLGTKDNKFTAKEFAKAITAKELVGTNHLCRSPHSILSLIGKQKTQNSSESEKKTKGFVKSEKKGRGICYGCRLKKYDYSLHSVKLDTSGRCAEPRRIFEREFESYHWLISYLLYS